MKCLGVFDCVVIVRYDNVFVIVVGLCWLVVVLLLYKGDVVIKLFVGVIVGGMLVCVVILGDGIVLVDIVLIVFGIVLFLYGLFRLFYYFNFVM